MNFLNEKDFQIWLGRKIKKFGFDVYTDKKICELPTFHGDMQKPDLLIFYKKNYHKNKVIDINSPFAIEIKFNDKNNKFNNLSKSILQIKKYYNKKYKTNEWEGQITNIFLSTNHYIFKNKIYDWEIANLHHEDKSFHQGMNWATIRILSTLSNKSGFIEFRNNHFTIETPNTNFFLLKNGCIGYSPNEWNNFGRGEE